MAVIRYGNACLSKCRFNLTHGVNPSTLEADSPGLVVWPLGLELTVSIEGIGETGGQAFWRGKVLNPSMALSEGSGFQSRVSCIDYRDDLNGNVLFAQVNMLNHDTGEIYTVWDSYRQPDGTMTNAPLAQVFTDWERQFPWFGFIPPHVLFSQIFSMAGWDSKPLYLGTAKKICNWADSTNWLDNPYNVYNLDWNNGVKFGAAIGQMCERLGIQSTIDMSGATPRAIFSMPGESYYNDDPDLKGILLVDDKGRVTNNQNVDVYRVALLKLHAHSADVGSRWRPEVDTAIQIIGDRNLYEMTNVPLVPDWNPNWNYFIFNPLALSECCNDMIDEQSEKPFQPGFMTVKQFNDNATPELITKWNTRYCSYDYDLTKHPPTATRKTELLYQPFKADPETGELNFKEYAKVGTYVPNRGHEAPPTGQNFVRKWSGKDLNLMLVSDYVRTVPWKLWRIQGISDFMPYEEFFGLRPVHDPPIVTPLISDPNLQYIVRKMMSNDDDVKEFVFFRSPYIGEMQGGYAVDVKTGHVKFDDAVWTLDPSISEEQIDKRGIKWWHFTPRTDDMFPSITFVARGEMYRHMVGSIPGRDTPGWLDKRVGVRHVTGLRKSYIINVGQPVGADNRPSGEPAGDDWFPTSDKPYPHHADGGPIEEFLWGRQATPPIPQKTADQIAEDIGRSQIPPQRQRITISGQARWDGTLGRKPDGEISRVSVTYDNTGVHEEVTFSADKPDWNYEPQFETMRHIATVQQARKADKIRSDRTLAAYKEAFNKLSLDAANPRSIATQAMQELHNAYAAGNWTKVSPSTDPSAANDHYPQGTAVCAIGDTHGGLVAIPLADVVANDTHFIGVAIFDAAPGAAIMVSTNGITGAVTEAPVKSGDKLGVAANGGALVKGHGAGKALAAAGAGAVLPQPVALAVGSRDDALNADCATTGAIDIAKGWGALGYALDGYEVNADDIILVHNQTDPAENGLYTASFSIYHHPMHYFNKQSLGDPEYAPLIQVLHGDIYKGRTFHGTSLP